MPWVVLSYRMFKPCYHQLQRNSLIGPCFVLLWTSLYSLVFLRRPFSSPAVHSPTHVSLQWREITALVTILYLTITIHQCIFVSQEHKRVISSTCIFVADANIHCMGQNYTFSLWQKSLGIKIMFHEIFCTFPTVNISKRHFSLVICIAKNVIWTTLNVIFSIFRFRLRFQIFK